MSSSLEWNSSCWAYKFTNPSNLSQNTYDGSYSSRATYKAQITTGNGAVPTIVTNQAEYKDPHNYTNRYYYHPNANELLQ